jgi:uncharacterized protein
MGVGATMQVDVFQAVRRDGADAVPMIAELPDVNLVRDDGMNLLHTAVAYHNTPAAQALISRSINVNAKDENGSTPLHYAANHNDLEMLELLLRNGADVSIEDKHGNTALWTAVHGAHGKYDLVDSLLRHGASLYARKKNKYQRSPLDLATQKGDAKLVDRLTESS